ncbi:MAG: hypothetical protein GWN71_24820, partial [Gammaproteobacteria bacterium]|nr:hypothetical protein [Gemmatimonadota bacterium]NIR38627.1 hypothetical protein [Actinomycetota bacterium]NIU76667.1 hypothetical protein [Gammaproteobacteria bacterium]NIX38270.1 hypothetical protein [Gemmatimonadota bacterium]
MVDRSAPGSLTVSLAAPDESPYFHRTFRARETREVRIYLRGGDDEVLVRGDADPGMIVRLVGGPDDDRYDVRGRGDGIHVYDHEGTD